MSTGRWPISGRISRRPIGPPRNAQLEPLSLDGGLRRRDIDLVGEREHVLCERQACGARL